MARALGSASIGSAQRKAILIVDHFVSRLLKRTKGSERRVQPTAVAAKKPRLLRHPGVQTFAHEGDTVLLAGLDKPQSLNDVGAFIWNQIATPTTRREVLDALLREYEASEPTASRDLDQFLEILYEEHLVLRLSPTVNAPPTTGPEGKLDNPPIAEEELIPERLFVRVFLHELDSVHGRVPCWSYVTKGLWSVGQKELVYIVKRETNEGQGDYPRQLLRHAAVVHLLSLQGRTVDVGGSSSFACTSGPLEQAGLRGIIYTPPQQLEGVPVEDPSLTCVFLTAEELKVAQTFGRVRVMSMLGKRHRFFPTAPWIDRTRADIVTMNDMKDSVLEKFTRITISALVTYQSARPVSRDAFPGPGGMTDHRIRCEDQHVVVELVPGAAGNLREYLSQLAPEMAVALIANFDPNANAYLVWKPGDEEAHSISRGESMPMRIAGNFVAFAPGLDEDGGVLLEDGFFFKLTDESWQRVRQALMNGEALSLQTGDGFDLEIVWLSEV
jgi:hypothetical protein